MMNYTVSSSSRVNDSSTLLHAEDASYTPTTLAAIGDADAAAQIRATLWSWSCAWNRGDILGYCDSYTDTARYLSVSPNGRALQLQGKERITQCFQKVFAKAHASSSTGGAQGSSFMEYSNLQIQVIPPMNTHAVVFGEYELQFGPTVERGAFTLHLLQTRGIWRIQSEHSSAMSK